MNNKTISITASSMITLAAAAIFLVAGFISGNKAAGAALFTGSPAPACEDEHALETEQHTDHDHESEQLTLEELEHKECEHGTAAVDCEECRFEVGVVRIDRDTIEPMLETGIVEKINRTRSLTLTGEIEFDARKTVQAAPAAGGRIKLIEKYQGDKVQKGDVLAIIHSDELGQAKAAYIELCSALELARASFEREQQLYEKKIGSKADYLSAENGLKAAQAALTALNKRLTLFGLDSEQIAAIKDEEKNGSFADLVLTAPQSGTLVKMDAVAGQIADSGQTTCTITDLSSLWIWCDVYEKDLATLLETSTSGEPLQAKIKVNAFEQATFSGKIDFIGNEMNEYTRTVKMRVLVDNPNESLRAGMFAAVKVELPGDGQAVALPATAVMEDEGEKFVFMHWKDELWVRRDVELGESCGDYVELLGGVPLGAEIVTGGAFMLKSDVLREKMGAGCAD